MEFSDLVQKKLVQIRKHESMPLNLYRYSKKVFWDGLFEDDIRFRFTRGLGVHDDGRVIIRPFFKVYNLGENDAGGNWKDEDPIIVERKINGFMGCVTRFDGQLIYTTTGTFDSDYASMAQRYIEDQIDTDYILDGRTYVFEICAKEDPHIVEEKMGVYLLGIHPNDEIHLAQADGYHYDLFPDAFHYYFPWQVSHHGAHQPRSVAVMQYIQYLTHMASTMGSHPVERGLLSFAEAKRAVKECDHEGFMMTNLSDKVHHIDSVLKAKSPLYLSTKFFARYRIRGDENLEKIKERVAEEYYPLLDRVFTEYTDFFELEEQDRIKYVRSWASENL